MSSYIYAGKKLPYGGLKNYGGSKMDTKKIVSKTVKPRGKTKNVGEENWEELFKDWLKMVTPCNRPK